MASGTATRGRSRVFLILAILLFVGAIVGLQFLNNLNVRPAVAHDHDGDGKPDHGDEVKD